MLKFRVDIEKRPDSWLVSVEVKENSGWENVSYQFVSTLEDAKQIAKDAMAHTVEERL